MSEWGPVLAWVRQGTKLGPWLFLLMINDLKVDALTWKYIDDTTIAQTVPRNSMDGVQYATYAVEACSQQNRMQYVDDSTIAQTVPRSSMGRVQNTVSAVELWSQT